MPSVHPATRLYWKDSISQPAARNRCCRWSLPMMPSCSGFTGALLHLHRGQQSFDRADVQAVAVAQRRERRSSQAGRLQHLLLLRRAAQAAELGDELAHRAVAAVVLVVGDVAGDQPLQVLRLVPVRGRRIGRPPLRPATDRSPRRSSTRPNQFDGERQVRVQPRVVVGDL